MGHVGCKNEVLFLLGWNHPPVKTKKRRKREKGREDWDRRRLKSPPLTVAAARRRCRERKKQKRQSSSSHLCRRRQTCRRHCTFCRRRLQQPSTAACRRWCSASQKLGKGNFSNSTIWTRVGLDKSGHKLDNFSGRSVYD